MADQDDFLALASKWAPFFRTHVTIMLALRDPHAERFLLRYALSVFTDERFPDFAPLQIATKSIRVDRQLQHLTEDQAIAQMTWTVAETMTVNTSLGTFTGDGSGRGYRFHKLAPPRLAGPKRYPALETVLYGPGRNYDLEVLSLELRTHNIPFDSFAELLSELQLPLQITELSNEAARTEIILEAPASLIFASEVSKGSTISGNILRLALKMHPKMRPEQLTVGLKQLHSRIPVTRSQIAVDPTKWSVVDEHQTATLEKGVADVPLAQVMLTYDGDLVGSWWIRDPGQSFNERLQLHHAIDPTGQFASSFFAERDDFENRVALLLTLLGLTILPYGGIAQLTDAPDILAISAARHLYVIDCTTGDIDRKGKLHRLYDRANRIRTALATQAQPPASVMPLVFTTLTRQETAVHHATAANYQIGLMCREDIEALFPRLDIPPTPEQVHAAALASIPVINRGPPAGSGQQSGAT